MGNDALTTNDLNRWLVALGAPEASARTIDRDVAFFADPYNQDSRGYHNDYHRAQMGQETLGEELQGFIPEADHERMAAVRAISGQGHDIAYMQVDGAKDAHDVFHTALGRQLGPLVDVPNFPEFDVVQLSPDAQRDQTTQMVAEIFDIDPQAPIPPKGGGNEFFSALATAKWMEEKGVPQAEIASVSTVIAATVPFKASGYSEDHPHPDGHMGTLSENLAKANEKYGLGMREQDVDSTMYVAVDIANEDISGFFSKNFAEMVHGGKLLTPENSPNLAGHTPNLNELMGAYSPGLYEMLQDPNSPIQPENIPHHYKGYPDAATHEAHVAQIRENVDNAVAYNHAKKVGISLAASIATMTDEQETPVDELLNGKTWAQDAHPHGPNAAAQDDPILGALTNLGFGDAGQFDIDRSPIAAFMYERLGKDGMEKLYEDVGGKPNFDSKEEASAFFDKAAEAMGAENMGEILDQIRNVATAAEDEAPTPEAAQRTAKLDQLAAEHGLDNESRGQSR